jgi:Tfp pilus assembly protein PilW
MISMVIGLIVVAGAVSLIVAIDQSNSEAIQSTRLTQELRTLAAVIADDVKRTRRVDDPVAMVGQGTAKTCATSPIVPAQPCYPIYTVTVTANSSTVPSCLTYGYTGTVSSQSVFNYRAVKLVNNNLVMYALTFDPNDGSVTPGTTALPTITPANCPAVAGTTSYQLNSTQVGITSFCVSRSTDGSRCYFDGGTCKLNSTVAADTPGANEIDICIAGKLNDGDAYMRSIKRGFVQPVFVRSTAAGS